MCGYLDTGIPDHDLDHGDPSHGYLDHGAPSSALGYQIGRASCRERV